MGVMLEFWALGENHTGWAWNKQDRARGRRPMYLPAKLLFRCTPRLASVRGPALTVQIKINRTYDMVSAWLTFTGFEMS